MGRVSRTLVAALLTLGCEFNSDGGGAPGGNSVGVDDTSGTSGRPATSTKGSAEGGPGGTVDSSDLDIPGPPETGPFVEFDGFAEADFGNVPPGGGEGRLLTLINNGNATATNLGPGGLDQPFDYQGIGYPGAGATCDDTLEPGQDCTVALVFAPETFGGWEQPFRITYGDGGAEATVLLRGTSAGDSDNLLKNGDGEGHGVPPNDWQNVSGSWETRDDAGLSNNGGWFIFGGPQNTDATVQLRQSVPLVAYAEVVDEGMLTYRFGGYARAFSIGNDPYQVQLVFLGSGGGELGMSDLGRRNNTSYQRLDDENSIPSGTRTIAVDLLCHRELGQNCSALFDDLELVVNYAAPG